MSCQEDKIIEAEAGKVDVKSNLNNLMFKCEECKEDDVNHPSYYTQGNIECIDAMESAYGIDAVISFCRGNAFKYQWRAGSKISAASLEKDLRKSQWYQNKLIELINKKNKIK